MAIPTCAGTGPGYGPGVTPSPSSPPPVRRALAVVTIAVALGVASFLVNVTTPAQATGQADALLVVRLTASRLLNAGTVWAGLPVLAGFLVRRPLVAAVAGVVAPLLALAVHYALAAITGWVPGLPWSQNTEWFAAALLGGVPLGLAGALAHRRDAVGAVAALVVPTGAALEPLVRGSFTVPDVLPWTSRLASGRSGAVLLLAGIVGVAMVVVTWWRTRRRLLAGR